MKKSVLILFAILFFLSLMVFPQWTDVFQKKISFNNSVYIMPGDKVFHKDTCKLLTGGRTGIAPELAEKRGYKPCPVCFPEAIPIKYEWGFSLQEPKKSNGLLYSDAFIDIVFLIEKTQIGFVIQNKTESGIKINWDDISIISPTGRASRAIHSGIKLIDKNSSQVPTVIPPSSKITDIVIPSENIQYDGGWKEGRLFDGDYMSFNGNEFSLYFPLEIKGGKKEYSFKFRISVSRSTPAPGQEK